MRSRPRVFPVIDVLDRAQAVRNAALAFAVGADGIFFDHADDDDGVLLTIATQLKSAWPDKLLGASYASLGPVKALQRSVRSGLDATWTVRSDVTARTASRDAVEAAALLKSRPAHRFFAAIAFCPRDVEAEPGLAAIRARELGMIPTTGGERVDGSTRKLETIRGAIGNAPLALAGSFTPDHLGSLSSLPSDLLVHTAGDAGFAYLDVDALRTCMTRVTAAAFGSASA
jgi:hypothetical protein